MTRRLLAAALLMLMLCAPPSRAAPAVLIDATLDARPAELVSIVGGTVSVFDAERAFQTLPAGAVLRVRLTEDGNAGTAVTPEAVLTLFDGQRLPGRPVPALPDAEGDAAEVLRWRTPLSGVLAVPLDRVRSVRLTPEAGPDAQARGDDAPLADTVTLRTGDTLTGFVEAFGAEGLQIDADDLGAVTLPLDRVRTVRLANPPAPREAVDRVTLRDGTRVDAVTLTVENEVLRLTPALAPSGDPMVIPLGAVAQLDLSAGGTMLIDVLDGGVRELAPGEAFGLRWPALREGSAMLMKAPGAVLLRVPAGARAVVLEVDVEPVRAGGDDAAVRLVAVVGDASVATAGPGLQRLRLALEPVNAEAELRLAVEAVEDADTVAVQRARVTVRSVTAVR